MTDFETRRQEHIAHALELMPAMFEAMDWPVDRIAKERDVRLRALLRTAVERSAWHRARLAGIDLEAPGEELLAALPTMTKHELMDHYDEILTDPTLNLAAVEAYLAGQPGAGYLLDRHLAVASGGSCGRRGVFVYGWTEFARAWIGCYGHVLRDLDFDRPATVAVVAAGHPTHGSVIFSRIFGGPHLPTVQLGADQPVPELVAQLDAARPSVLAGYPSMLHVLALETSAGRLRMRPSRVTTYAEPLVPEARAAIEAAWGVPVENVWATSEGGGIGRPCRAGRTHLAEDLAIVEAVDAAGNPVPAGTRSAKVFLTNLYNHTLPLIRFEITDEVVVRDEPCECGSGHRWVEDVQGRLDDTFHYGGVAVHPLVFRSPLGRREIVEYQVRQTFAGADVDVRAAGGFDEAALAAKLADSLRTLGVAEPVVRVRSVEFIERSPVGKLKRFVPLETIGVSR